MLSSQPSTDLSLKNKRNTSATPLCACAAVIQLMAAAKAKRGLAFFTFEDENLKQGLQQIYHLLLTEGTTVGESFQQVRPFKCSKLFLLWSVNISNCYFTENLYELLENFCGVQNASSGSHVDLFEFIGNNLKRSKSQL